MGNEVSGAGVRPNPRERFGTAAGWAAGPGTATWPVVSLEKTRNNGLRDSAKSLLLRRKNTDTGIGAEHQSMRNTPQQATPLPIGRTGRCFRLLRPLPSLVLSSNDTRFDIHRTIQRAVDPSVSAFSATERSPDRLARLASSQAPGHEGLVIVGVLGSLNTLARGVVWLFPVRATPIACPQIPRLMSSIQFRSTSTASTRADRRTKWLPRQ
jgi:hypothetical protein